MQYIRPLSTHLFVLLTGFLLAILASQVFAAFSEPGVPPTGGNPAEPLNVSGTAQTKSGGLILNTGGATYGLSVDKGKVGIGTLTPLRDLQIGDDDDPDSTERAIRLTGGANPKLSLKLTEFEQAINQEHGFQLLYDGSPNVLKLLYGSHAMAQEGINLPNTAMVVSRQGLSAGNIVIGQDKIPDNTVRLEVVGNPVKTTGGLIIETRTSDPASPEAGRLWLRTDL